MVYVNRLHMIHKKYETILQTIHIKMSILFSRNINNSNNNDNKLFEILAVCCYCENWLNGLFSK